MATKIRGVDNFDTAKLANYSRKNLLLNGNFVAWQRGTDVTYSSSSGYGQYLSADRWGAYYNGTRVRQSTATVNGEYKITAITSSSGTGAPYIYQMIEDGSALLSGKTVTLSFWARASEGMSNLGDNMFRFYDHGTYTNPHYRCYVGDGPSYNLTTDWSKITVTVTLQTDSYGPAYGRGLFVVLSGNVPTGWIEIADVQLELGDQPTEFEQRHFSEEISMCQRYYYNIPTSFFSGVSYGTNNSYDGFASYISFPTYMRTTPSITYSGGSDGGSSATLTAEKITSTGFTVNLRSTDSTTSVWWDSSRIQANAEI